MNFDMSFEKQYSIFVNIRIYCFDVLHVFNSNSKGQEGTSQKSSSTRAGNGSEAVRRATIFARKKTINKNIPNKVSQV